MGKKSSSVAGSAGKAAAKAAKKEKQEKLASRKAAKDDKKQSSLVAAAAGKSGKSGKGGKSNGGKGKKASAIEEEDLDALLRKFQTDWEEAHAVNEETVGGPPTRRANATLTPCPLGNDLWLFGGEYFDGDKAFFYADMYRYSPPSILPTHSLVSIPSDTDGIASSSSTSSTSSSAGTWRLYTSPNQPGPRSAHQVVPDARQGGLLWLFGGEFASPKQTSFHHYRDLWVFSIATKTWERVDTKVRPSARSGHRMVLWRQYLILFGGFIDTGSRTTYLQDLWMFDTAQYKWTEIPQNDLKRPSARSGFSLISTPEGVALYGGYCKRYVKGQRTQGVALEDSWFLKIHPQADGSLLPVNTPQGGKIEWEKRRKIGYAPGPRSGCTMAYWANKNMGVLFGGVMDREEDEESMESLLFDELFGYTISGSGRWISLNLRKKKKQGGAGGKKKREKAAAIAAAKAAEIEARVREQREEEEEEEARQQRAAEDCSDDSDDDQEEEDQDRPQPDYTAHFSSNKSRSVTLPATALTTVSKLPSTVEAPQAGVALPTKSIPRSQHTEEDLDEDPDLSRPLARFNAMLAVQRNVLYLYGGIRETASREYTLDDFHVVQLDKMERWVCLKECRIEGLEWNESDEEDDSDSDSDGNSENGGSDSSSDDGVGAQEGEEVQSLHSHSDHEDETINADVEDLPLTPEELAARQAKLERVKEQARQAYGVLKRGGGAKSTSGGSADGQSAEEIMSEEERSRTPNPGETLRMFFDRSRDYWARIAFEASHGEMRGKETRTQGFQLASQRYEEYSPVLREIEHIQSQAGLDAEEMRASAARASNGPLGGAGMGVESRNRR